MINALHIRMIKKWFIALGLIGLVACGSQVVVDQQSAGGVGGNNSSSISSSSGQEGSSSVASSSSTGIIDPCKELEYPEYDPCCGLADGSTCNFQDYPTSTCESGVCVFCHGKKLGEVVKGYPLDPEACYEYICAGDPGAPTLAFPQVHYHPLEDKCTWKALKIEGTCSEDGQCCGWVEEAMDHICGPGANE